MPYAYERQPCLVHEGTFFELHGARVVRVDLDSGARSAAALALPPELSGA